MFLIYGDTETRSDDDGLDLSEDDFFLSGSSSDEADADDELTDKSARLGLGCAWFKFGKRERER